MSRLRIKPQMMDGLSAARSPRPSPEGKGKGKAFGDVSPLNDKKAANMSILLTIVVYLISLNHTYDITGLCDESVL